MTNKQKDTETLAELRDAFDSIVEPNIEGMFRSIRKAKTLDDFKDAVLELSEFTECLYADISDLRGAVEDSEYDDDYVSESDDEGCA